MHWKQREREHWRWERWNTIGLDLERSGKWRQAIAVYRGLVHRYPDNDWCWFRLASALSGASDRHIVGCRRAAMMAYQEAIRLNPDFPEWHLNLGCLYDEAGNTEQAIACWRRAIVLDENHTSARLNLSYALCVTGKPREAMDVLQEAAAREKQTSQLVRVAERIIELYRDYPEAFREEWEE